LKAKEKNKQTVKKEAAMPVTTMTGEATTTEEAVAVAVAVTRALGAATRRKARARH